MKYIVKLNEDKDIIDLCYAIKDVGEVVPMEYKKTIGAALSHIEEETKNMPLNGCKLRLLDVKEILEGGKDERNINRWSHL